MKELVQNMSLWSQVLQSIMVVSTQGVVVAVTQIEIFPV